jgi:hypothetical protein
MSAENALDLIVTFTIETLITRYLYPVRYISGIRFPNPYTAAL